MSVLILVKNKEVATLSYLFRLVLKNIYEPGNMSSNEEYLMQHSIVWWNKKLDKTWLEKENIEKLGAALKKNEDGGFEKRKKSFSDKGIDYRKFHRLPESYSVKN